MELHPVSIQAKLEQLPDNRWVVEVVTFYRIEGEIVMFTRLKGLTTTKIALTW